MRFSDLLDTYNLFLYHLFQGVILYEMLLGASPFTEGDRVRLREQIITADYVFPPQPKISEEARDLIQKLLVVDPEERLSSEQILRHPWLQVTVVDGLCCIWWGNRVIFTLPGLIHILV